MRLLHRREPPDPLGPVRDATADLEQRLTDVLSQLEEFANGVDGTARAVWEMAERAARTEPDGE